MLVSDFKSGNNIVVLTWLPGNQVTVAYLEGGQGQCGANTLAGAWDWFQQCVSTTSIFLLLCKQQLSGDQVSSATPLHHALLTSMMACIHVYNINDFTHILSILMVPVDQGYEAYGSADVEPKLPSDLASLVNNRECWEL